MYSPEWWSAKSYFNSLLQGASALDPRRSFIPAQAGAGVSGVGMAAGGSLRRPNVVFCESRMIGEYRRYCHSGAQLAQNRLNRDARAANDGLTPHHIGIGLDPLVSHMRLASSLR